MTANGYPAYDIIKKGEYGMPYNPSPEASIFIERNIHERRHLFLDKEVKEGQIIEAGRWMFVYQCKRVGTDWRDLYTDMKNFTDPIYPEPGEEYRFIYRLK